MLKPIKSDFIKYFLANSIYSLSTFVINLILPVILAPDDYCGFVYLFQMVLYLTCVAQLGLTYGLYKYYSSNKSDILNSYYFIINLIVLALLILGLWRNNFVSSLLKLGSFSYIDNLFFYLSVIVSNLFLFNKGKNIIECSYTYMLQISAVVFVFRVLSLFFVKVLGITFIPVLLALFFIVPFFQDIRDFFKNTFRYFHFKDIDPKFIKSLLTYCLKVWLIGFLYMTSDRLFLIQTKGLDDSLTIAVGFASGFIGIISLFNSTFTNFFVAKLSGNSNSAILEYISRLNRVAPFYFTALLLFCTALSWIVYAVYPSFGMFESTILFVSILKIGVISFLGMYTLLVKVLDILSYELFLNVLRLVVTYCLCTFWHPQSHLLWYSVIMFLMLIPECLLLIKIRRVVNAQD